MSAPGTDDLILRLAREAARDTRVRSFPLMLPSAVSLAAPVASLVLALWLLGARYDVADRLGDGWFHQKLACMAAFGLGAAIVLVDLARPDRRRPRLAALLPGAALMAFGALTDPSGLALGGRSALSVPTCVGAILLLALPGLALLFVLLRGRAAVTRPALTGAVAGLLSGAGAGAAYALVCRNDGGLFVAVWYGAALALAAGLGALFGRQLLRW